MSADVPAHPPAFIQPLSMEAGMSSAQRARRILCAATRLVHWEIAEIVTRAADSLDDEYAPDLACLLRAQELRAWAVPGAPKPRWAQDVDPLTLAAAAAALEVAADQFEPRA